MTDRASTGPLTVSRGGTATPLYEQVSRAIEDIALARELADDSPLPAEAALMRRFGVSRGTIRRAMELLEQRGLVSREVGRGTYVNPVARLRRIVWQRLEAVAIPDSRFDLDFQAFVPDFQGSTECMERLVERREYTDAGLIFVAPDNNLEEFRARACTDGKRVLVATYGIRRGFVLLEDVPPEDAARAASLDGLERVGRRLALSEVAALPPIDLVVTGAAAVTMQGVHFGKGHGYFDLEWGILRHLELVEDHTPVVACVHDCQVVDEELPSSPYDCTVDLVITPSRVIACDRPAKPLGVLWGRVDTATVEAIPYLAELMRLPQGRAQELVVGGEHGRRRPSTETHRVLIDRDACMAAGECQRALPQLFGLGDDGVVVLVGDPADHPRHDVTGAAATCPNFALEVDTNPIGERTP